MACVYCVSVFVCELVAHIVRLIQFNNIIEL